MKKNMWLAVGMAFALVLCWSLSGYAACKVGEKLQVNWKGSWYPAKVQKVKGDECFIHYDGYGKSWDEWVGPDRIKMAAGKEPSATDSSEYKKGDAVQVNWKGKWWPAHVIAVKNGKPKVHYDGYDNSWDEWVGPDRIKK